ncbi:MAG TPA: hypothetical protein VKP64_10435 [Mycobacteriales bacterium]|nr:hypothetical protein [Mycobacteriales bacterium]
MRRALWLALGAALGVLVVRRLTAAPAPISPTGLADSVRELGEAVRDSADGRNGMAARAGELRSALGVEPPSRNGETPAPSASGEVS